MSAVEISKNKSDINIDALSQYLTKESYWAKNRSKEKIIKSIEHSICYSVLLGNVFIGFARIITDHATFAYLCDVFILPEYQHKSYGKHLLEFIVKDSELKDIHVYLLTLDGHKFYEKFGFVADADLINRVMRRKMIQK